MALLAAFALAGGARAKDDAADELGWPHVKPGYSVARTQWGDPDLQGIWPLQNVNDAGIPLQRPEEMGTRLWLTDSEFAQRLAEAEQSDAEYSVDIGGGGTRGLAEWLRRSSLGRRTSMLIAPANGRLPPLTPQAEAQYKMGRSTWQVSDAIDWVTDLDPFERCITRGFPAVMLTQPYNNGIRIFQSPGYFVIALETFGTRIIRVGHGGSWPQAVRAWYGDSRGRWEGDTLIVETTNLVSGDSATYDVSKRAAGPFPGRNNATVPVGPEARVTERFTRIGPDTLDYRVIYDDPDVFTAPWTVALERTRDDGYRMYEYACHEGSTVRNVITAARARRKIGAGS